MNQEKTGSFDKRRSMHYSASRLIALVAVGLLLITIAVMNSTSGRFAYPDTDGCACFVSYTAHHSLAACEQTRSMHCDGTKIDRLLVYLSYLDFKY
jgi:hypothetical protein